MDIKILGPGCVKCRQVEALVRDAVAETGKEAQIEHVTEFRKIADYGVFATPSVVLDGEVKCVGKIPKKEEIKAWLDEAAR